MASSSTKDTGLRQFLQEDAEVELDEESSGPTAKGARKSAPKRTEYPRPGGGMHLARPVTDNKADAKDEVELLRTLRAAGIFCQLIGPPGTGKTSVVEAAFGEDLVTVVCSEGTDEDALTGGYRPDPEEQWKRVEGAVVRAMREGMTLYLDEVGALHPRVAAKLHGLFDGRLELALDQFDGEIVKAADGFYTVISYNPGPEFQLSEAMQSRFGFVLRVGTDLKTAERIGVPHKAVKLAERLYKLESANEIAWAPQLRELVVFRDVEELLGEGWAIRNLVGAAPEEAAEQVIEEAEGIFDGVRVTALAL